MNTTTMNPSTYHRKRPSGVSFAPNSELFTIDYPEDFDQAQECYTKEDHVMFKKEARADIDAFLQLKDGTSTPQNENMCLVGIENYLMSSDPNQRARARRLVSRVVLAEQARWRGRGFHLSDDYKSERIANVSRQCTSQAASRARMIGNFQYIQSSDDE